MTTVRERLGVEEKVENNEETQTGTSVFRMYAIDKHGFKVNWAVSADTTEGQLNNMVKRQEHLSNWMSSHEYSPDDFGASARTAPRATGSPSAPANDNPACSVCGGETEYKQGTGKNGKAWSAYFCIKTKDEPQARKHTPIWI